MSDSPEAALTTFLARMAVDPAAFARFVADAAAAVTEADLSPEERALLFSGDQNRLYAALASAHSAPRQGAHVASPPGAPAAGVNDEDLVVVGTGIRAIGQLTGETIAWMKSADTVLYISVDPVADAAIRMLNPRGAESLLRCYGDNKLRAETYREIVDITMAHVRARRRTCLAVYGHPGVLTLPTHEVIRRARAEGFKARMLPAISAADCLFADLGVDQVGGYASYEATDFLLNVRSVDPAAHLILWQIGGLGDPTYKRHHYDIRGLAPLAGKLMRHFGPQHTVFLYEAAMFPGVEPLVRSGPLALLPQSAPTPNSTLYVPPVCHPQPDPAIRPHAGWGQAMDPSVHRTGLHA
jgi:hypothetical protein